MKIAFIFFTDDGLGHCYRSSALRKEATRVGYKSIAITDWHETLDRIHVSDIGDTIDSRIITWLNGYKPDWLVVDLPIPIPEWLTIYARNNRIWTVALNGVGHDKPDMADIIWVQDDPLRVIIRPEIFEIPDRPLFENSWFVWGGARDPMNLRYRFESAMPHDPAMLTRTCMSLGEHCVEAGRKRPVNDCHYRVFTNGIDIFHYMSICERACVSMGMICWELAAMGKPVYAFSKTSEHLRFAQNMENLGLIKAYPEVGIPDNSEIQRFLRTPFTPTGKKPDGNAAYRLLNLMNDVMNGWGNRYNQN